MIRVPRGRSAAPPPDGDPLRAVKRAALWALALCWAGGVPALAVAQACTTPPPPVPAALLRSNTKWDSLATWMTENGIHFTGDTTQSVLPCDRCVQIVGTVASESHTPCLTRELAGDGQYRFVGLVVTRDRDRSLVHLGIGGPNVTDSVYLVVQDSGTLVVFRGQNRTVQSFKQNVHANLGWRFRFHDEIQTFSAPEARWRPSSDSLIAGVYRAHARPAVHGGGPTDLFPADDDQEDTFFAWMACASGCCQFHGLPAGSGDPNPEGHRGHQGRPRMQVHKDP